MSTRHAPPKLLVMAGLAAVATAIPACQSGPAEPRVRNITIQEPNNVAAARDLAMQAQAAQNPEDAVRLYREAVNNYPGFAAAWNNLGVLLMEQGRYLQAAEAFATAGERAPTDPRPFYNLGLTWERTRHIEDAARYYDRALERDPRFLPALRGYIHAEDRLGEVRQATMDRLRTALVIEDDPDWREYFEQRRLDARGELDERFQQR